MVYVVAVYDVEADRTRLFLKLFRRYLAHVQHSVFEGEITEGKLEELSNEVEERLEPEESVIIYELSSASLVDRRVFGPDPAEDHQFL